MIKNKKKLAVGIKKYQCGSSARKASGSINEVDIVPVQTGLLVAFQCLSRSTFYTEKWVSMDFGALYASFTNEAWPYSAFSKSVSSCLSGYNPTRTYKLL